MKIPKKLKVGGHDYKVVFPYKFTERTDRCGQTNHDTFEILLTGKTPNGHDYAPSAIGETFVHEILHCVDVVYNAGKLDEDTVVRLGQGLYQVLKDNNMLR